MHSSVIVSLDESQQDCTSTSLLWYLITEMGGQAGIVRISEVVLAVRNYRELCNIGLLMYTSIYFVYMVYLVFGL